MTQRSKSSVLSTTGQNFPLPALLVQFSYYLFYLNCSIVPMFCSNKLITGCTLKVKQTSRQPCAIEEQCPIAHYSHSHSLLSFMAFFDVTPNL